MHLERITVEFAAEEDRLLLRVYFSGSAEVMFWLTRRLVKRFWPVLLEMAQSRPDIRMQANPEARLALIGFEHEKALRQVKFTRAVQEPNRQHPLGEAPMLVTRIRARRNERGLNVLSLLPREGSGVDLTLGDNLLHGLMKLIQDTAVKAEWDLKLGVPSLAAVAGESPRDRVLN
ncbi:MAG TPA: hypothetical protein VNM24_13980 [Burkholderiales bacterium]|jgi:hypothetical protein|nr:hypothetical protein [Burkholderiales bacterium]